MPYLYFCSIALGAFLWAKLEIEIEGKDGWAGRLPTWRVDKHKLLDWLYGGRPLTGYHTWAYAVVFFFFHLHFFWEGSWSARWELHTLGGYALFWVLEDFLWFVLNPHFGWKKFKPEHVWWHRRWVLGLPVDYWLFTACGLALLLLP